MIDENNPSQGTPNIQFGKYQIFRKLAVGGMAELFLAKQTGLGSFERTVVLKCILPHLAQEEQFITMFLDEARVASLLNHPNIVQIYEIGEVDGVCYIAMEYIRGPNLKAFRKRLYQRNPRPHYSLFAGIVAQTAAGLHNAHEATDERGMPLEIVHRDISPTNLLLSYSGAVKLVDFGVAKAAIQEHKTRAGMVKGKYRYMSPEQILAKPVDRRSDLYALGAILYELTTNVVVFSRRTEAETIQAVHQEPIMPPISLIEGFPSELNDIIMKCLERDVEKRYQTARALRKDLEHFMHNRGLFFGTPETSDLLQGLFAEEQEYERTGLSGSSLSKSDYLRFTGELSNPVLPQGFVDHSSPSLRNSISSSFQSFGADHTMPSGPSAHAQHVSNVLVNAPDKTITAPSSPSRPSAVHGLDPLSASGSLPHATDTHASYALNAPTGSRGAPWWIVVLLLLVVAGGGYFVWTGLQEKSPNPSTGTQVRPSDGSSFSTLSTRIQEYIRKGQFVQANAQMGALKRRASTTQERMQVLKLQAQIEQQIECSPKLAVAKEFYKKSEYKLAEKVLTSLQKRCPNMPEVLVLLEQARDAQRPNRRRPSFRPPPRRRRYVRHRRRRRPYRASKRKVKTPIVRKKEMGLLYVNAPPLARVSIDGRLFGFTPINGKKLSVGQHTIQIQLKGYQSYSKHIVIRAEQQTIVAARMYPLKRIAPRPTLRRVEPRKYIAKRPTARRNQPRMDFSAVRLPRRRTLRVFITDPRGIVGRSYTGQHRILCTQIEREVQRVMGSTYSIRGITRPWLQYIRKYGARLGRDRLIFYPRAVAYVIYTQLKRGRTRSRTAQIIVNYERRRRWKRFQNR